MGKTRGLGHFPGSHGEGRLTHKPTGSRQKGREFLRDAGNKKDLCARWRQLLKASHSILLSASEQRRAGQRHIKQAQALGRRYKGQRATQKEGTGLWAGGRGKGG